MDWEERDARAPFEVAPTLSALDRALLAAENAQPDALLRVSLVMAIDPFDAGQLRSIDVADRKVLSGLWTETIDDYCRDLVRHVEQIGGVNHGALWINRTLNVSVPAMEVPGLLSRPEVEDLMLSTMADAAEWYTGKELKDQIRVTQLFNAGFTTSQGNRSDDGEIRIGIIEPAKHNGLDNHLGTAHVGWNDFSSGGPDRISFTFHCDENHTPAMCVVETPSPGTATTHAQSVSWIATGSIEQGQDSAHPGTRTVSQQKRSGVMPEAEIWFYRTTNGDWASRAGALQSAITNGIDVVNMSLGGSACDPNINPSNFNAAARSAFNAGILLVKSAGNLEPTPGCSLTYPGYFPEWMAVGALDTESGTPALSTTTLVDFSSEGPVPIKVNGVSRTTSGVHVVAPGCYSNSFKMSAGYHDGWFEDIGCATSWAAPAVSGAAGYLRDVLDGSGWSISADRAGRMHAAIALFADRWIGPGSGTRTTTKTSDQTGYGRMRIHGPNQLENGRFVMSHVDLYSLQSATINPVKPSGLLTQFKFVAVVVPDDLNDAPDYVVELENTCFNGQTVTLAQDTSFNFTKRVTWNDGSGAFNLEPGCVRVRVFADHVPNAPLRVFYAYYFHDESLVTH